MPTPGPYIDSICDYNEVDSDLHDSGFQECFESMLCTDVTRNCTQPLSSSSDSDSGSPRVREFGGFQLGAWWEF